MDDNKLFDELYDFFIKVNKARTDFMRKENPNNSYEYFPKDEEPELVIRKGMTQYEDLVKQFKKIEKKWNDDTIINYLLNNYLKNIDIKKNFIFLNCH